MVKAPLGYLTERCSIRKFKEKKVEKEKMHSLINAAQRAPTAGNMQPYSFIIIDEEDKRETL